jgi:propionyl-CoA carboxylase alpha chain
VREQLRIAQGEPLGYQQRDITWTGHAIEARLYAEDPDRGFLPTTGTLDAFKPALEPAVRWDSGVVQGSEVGVDFDPMLAKVIAHRPTRSEASAALALALENLHVGGVVTNRDFLAATLRHPVFLAGDTTTDFIERVDPATTGAADLASTSGAPSDADISAILAALWWQGARRADDQLWGFAPSNWRNGVLPAQRIELRLGTGSEPVTVGYRARRDGSFVFESGHRAVVHRWSPDHLDAEIDGLRLLRAVTPVEVGDQSVLHLQTATGTVTVEQLPRFPLPGSDTPSGGLTAPMPGIVLDVRCQAGDTVTAGTLLVVLEAMKMEHHLVAPVDGVVTELAVAVGQQVDNGALLLTLEPAADTETGAHP